MSQIPAPIQISTETGLPIPVLEIGGTHVTGALVDPMTMQVIDGTRVRGSFGDVRSAEGILATIAETANSIRPSSRSPRSYLANGQPDGGSPSHENVDGEGPDSEGPD